MFIIDEDLVKYNLTNIEDDQMEWLLPIKMVNIVKIKLIAWRRTLTASNRVLENRSNWIERMATEVQEDLETFTEKLKDKYPNEIQEKIHLRRIT